jgi:hypothetical protein
LTFGQVLPVALIVLPFINLAETHNGNSNMAPLYDDWLIEAFPESHDKGGVHSEENFEILRRSSGISKRRARINRRNTPCR